MDGLPDADEGAGFFGALSLGVVVFDDRTPLERPAAIISKPRTTAKTKIPAQPTSKIVVVLQLEVA
jgi:hypothetical protein